MDTNSLQVEWLGAEDAKQDDRGMSAGGREARFFRAKNRLTCDLRRATVWLSSGASPGIKKSFSIFSMNFLAFLKPHHCRFTSLLVHKNRQ